MVEVTIQGGQMSQLRKAVRNIENGVPRVLTPAINRSLESGRTTVRREIRKVYVIKQKDIPVTIKRANKSNLQGSVVIEQGMLPLSKFNVRPMFPTKRRRTVFAQVKKLGGMRKLPGAFVAEMPTGYTGPFIRAAGAGRLPVHKLLTIGAPIMASQPAVGPAVSKAMGETLAKRVDHELTRVLASAGGK